MNAALNDKAIKLLMSNGNRIVEPFDELSLQPASIDLKLGNTSYEYNLDKYILGDKIDEKLINKKTFNSLPLESGKVVFVGIHEKISIPENTMGIIFPRSSITRLGIQIVSTYMNPGYTGYMPLTIINHTGYQVLLKPGIRIVQLSLFFLNDRPDKLYKDINDKKYFEEKVAPSKLHTDQELNKAMEQILEREAPILHGMMNK